jgi:hypothetical protein
VTARAVGAVGASGVKTGSAADSLVAVGAVSWTGASGAANDVDAIAEVPPRPRALALPALEAPLPLVPPGGAILS